MLPNPAAASSRRRPRGVRSRLVAVTAAVALSLTGCSVFGGGKEADNFTPSPVGPAGTPSSPAASASGAASATPTADPASDPALAKFYGQKPTWTTCYDTFQCAKVTVPVDWATPGGETLQLAVIRRQTTGTKLGSLFVNPGGPGVSGVGWLRSAATTYGRALRQAYDLVSWDPRGIGGSAPVRCLPNADLDAYYAEDQTPDTAAEETRFVSETKRYIAACQAHTGELLKHVDTISTAKDMDVLRAAVGDQTFTYFGASYGTFLGAWYAQEFPWRVGRLVLDGAVDPSQTAPQFTEGQAQGFARAVQGYVDNCLTQQECPLRGTRADAYAQLQRLMTQLDANPLRTDSGRMLTQALFSTGLLQGMYSKSLWPAVTQGLTDALKGNGTTMLLLADSYNERDDKGQYEQTLQVTSAIFCLDHPDSRSLDQIKAEADRLKAKYPPFGDVIGWGALGCTLWPFKANVPAEKLTAVGARPILVVGTTQDPATPYEWSQSLAKQLSSGRLLTRKGEGHTGYGSGSRCTDQAVERYLVSGVLPAEGTTCS